MTNTYRLEITVLSPLHIGSGERLGPKSVWVDDGRAWVVDEGALFRKLASSPRLLSQFERFSLDRRRSLKDFLQDAYIDPVAVALYELEHFGGRPNRFYMSHIKAPGRPPRLYIPGSSLKGAIRSALLRATLIQDSAQRQQAARHVRSQIHGSQPNRKRADDALERAVFGQDQHHEWTRLFQIADTQPVAIEKNLQSTEARILSVCNEGTGRLVEKKGRRGQPISLYPEVIRRQIKLHARLTILDELLSPLAAKELGFPMNRSRVGALLEACNCVAEEQIQQEHTFATKTRWKLGELFYSQLKIRLEEAIADGACLLRLGWGAGYDDKTITDLLDDATFREVLDSYRLTVGRPHRSLRNPPLPRPFAPKSRTVALNRQNQWVPLGWVQFQLAPAKVAEEQAHPPVTDPPAPVDPPAEPPPPTIVPGPHTGVVVYYNFDRGRGAILPDGNETELEVRLEQLREGVRFLVKDQKVSFTVVLDDAGIHLEDVKPEGGYV
jgi:CRISPR-associated protein Csm5